MTSSGELSHLYIAAPTVSARLDPDVLASTIARLLGSGRASCKADLVRATGLSRTTIDSGVQLLLRHSVIRHAGLRRIQGRGRSAELLELDPSFGYILVADCGAHAAALRVFDISQRELAAGTVHFELSDGPESVLGAIAAEFARLLTDMPHEALVAVIGLPGPVDNRSGSIVRPPIMPGWDGFPITKVLTASLGCRVILENDVNLRALGEARADRLPDGPLLYVKVGTGIGAGIVTGNGELLHGADGSAGDVGHLRVAGSDALCVCGNRGCLEAVGSASAIWRAIKGIESVSPVSGREIQELQDLIVSGDPRAIAELRAAAEFVGEAVANLVHILNPARVVLGGMLVSSSDVLLAIVRSVVYQRALPLATRELMLGAPTLGTLSGIAGGLIAGIDEALAIETIGAHFRSAQSRENIA
jgi:predicted NBD/HSP70 family sugar kinase